MAGLHEEARPGSSTFLVQIFSASTDVFAWTETSKKGLERNERPRTGTDAPTGRVDRNWTESGGNAP